MVRRLALALALTVALGCRSTHQASEATPTVPAARTASEATAAPAALAAEATAMLAAAASTAQVMRVHFIDVGQGAATLIEFPGETILVDTGGERWTPEQNQPPKYDSTKARAGPYPPEAAALLQADPSSEGFG